MKELLLAVFTKYFNKTDAELTPIIFNSDDTIKETAIQALLDMDVARVNKFKRDATTQHDNGYKKAQKEIATAMETKLKEKFAIDSEKIGDELIDEIHTAVSDQSKKSKLTADEVKLHPTFIAFEKEQKRLRDEAVTAKEKELNDFKSGVEKTTTMTSVKDKVNSIYAELNPILPSKDAAKNQKQKTLFLKEFDAFDYEKQADGTFIIIEGGKRKETPNGHPVLFDDFVKEMVTSYYDLSAQQAKQGTGNDNDKDKKKPVVNGQINMNPKSPTEFAQSLDALEKLNDNAKIVELNTNYETYKTTQK